ncbi:MAG: LysM peptidoglycan-binding domain-containing protein [Deltaproteobacteria bacterium]|nr:LysM peptidoglycan-binding domain-containing protein [Deltaproteobacteria bacterium]
MKKERRQVILLVLGVVFLFLFFVSCVSLEKLGLRKGKQEATPAASQPAPAPQQQQANLPQGSPAAAPPAGTTQEETKPAPAKQQEVKQYFVHQVKWPNESLSIIAKWYTGSLMNWKALAKANPDMKPTIIHKGDRIRIPVHMLKTRDPMPEEFVDELVQSLKKKKSAQGTQEKKQEEEPDLFGPKEE